MIGTGLTGIGMDRGARMHVTAVVRATVTMRFVVFFSSVFSGVFCIFEILLLKLYPSGRCVVHGFRAKSVCPGVCQIMVFIIFCKK